jgi:hypothetical protein
MIAVVLSTISIILIVYLLFEIQKEKRRNRILQSFVAGIIRSICAYASRTDDISSASDIIKIYDKKFPIPYNEFLQNIGGEFKKDFWMNRFWKWIKKDRNLFYDGKYYNDGFNMIYWDFFDKTAAEIQKETEKEQKMNSQQNTQADLK